MFRPRHRRTVDFCILLPVHRSPELLPFAIASIFSQTERNFEIHIICDGAPEATAEFAAALAKHHREVAAHIHGKGPRNGEIYRDPIIRETKARYICQIADDDLWFPCHLKEIKRLLHRVDFGNTLQIDAGPEGDLRAITAMLDDPEIRARMLTSPFNIFGPTACGYTKSAYLALPEGWTAAPPNMWSDLFMWRKFLRHPELSFGSRPVFTNLHISKPRHGGLTTEQRASFNGEWWSHIENRSRRDEFMRFLRDGFLKLSDHSPQVYPGFVKPDEAHLAV